MRKESSAKVDKGLPPDAGEVYDSPPHWRGARVAEWAGFENQ